MTMMISASINSPKKIGEDRGEKKDNDERVFELADKLAEGCQFFLPHHLIGAVRCPPSMQPLLKRVPGVMCAVPASS